jgi:hypothetical protein
MKKLIENITGNYSSSASVVDGTLILSLPDAVTPVVWRLDMVQTRASALEVRPAGAEGFVLVLKTPRGDVHDIARFESKARAVGALMSVTRAMESSHSGHPGNAANDSLSYNPTHLPVPTRNAKRKKVNTSAKSWVAAVIAIVAIVILGSMLMNVAPRNIAPGMTATATPSSSATRSANPTPTPSGIPLSADEFLKNR